MTREGKNLLSPPVAIPSRLETQRAQRRKHQREEMTAPGTVEMRFRAYLSASRELPLHRQVTGQPDRAVSPYPARINSGLLPRRSSVFSVPQAKRVVKFLFEGEAPAAWLMEGATGAPVIA
jgi:hypothetical protein